MEKYDISSQGGGVIEKQMKHFISEISLDEYLLNEIQSIISLNKTILQV